MPHTCPQVSPAVPSVLNTIVVEYTAALGLLKAGSRCLKAVVLTRMISVLLDRCSEPDTQRLEIVCASSAVLPQAMVDGRRRGAVRGRAHGLARGDVRSVLLEPGAH